MMNVNIEALVASLKRGLILSKGDGYDGKKFTHLLGEFTLLLEYIVKNYRSLHPEHVPKISDDNKNIRNIVDIYDEKNIIGAVVQEKQTVEQPKNTETVNTENKTESVEKSFFKNLLK